MNVGRRKRVQPMVPLASMGDIAFLLIIFFVLTTHFMKESHIDAKLAASPEVDVMEPTQISVVVDEDGVIWLQGEQVTVGVLESAVQAMIEDSEDKTVMVKVDRELPHQQFGDVIMAITEAGAQIALVGREGEREE